MLERVMNRFVLLGAGALTIFLFVDRDYFGGYVAIGIVAMFWSLVSAERDEPARVVGVECSKCKTKVTIEAPYFPYNLPEGWVFHNGVTFVCPVCLKPKTE